MITVLLYKKFVTPFSNDCSIIKICSHFRGSASTSYTRLRRLCQSFMGTPVAFLSAFPGDFAALFFLMNFSERLSKWLQRLYSYFQESCKKCTLVTNPQLKFQKYGIFDYFRANLGTFFSK